MKSFPYATLALRSSVFRGGMIIQRGKNTNIGPKWGQFAALLALLNHKFPNSGRYRLPMLVWAPNKVRLRRGRVGAPPAGKTLWVVNSLKIVRLAASRAPY